MLIGCIERAYLQRHQTYTTIHDKGKGKVTVVEDEGDGQDRVIEIDGQRQEHEQARARGGR